MLQERSGNFPSEQRNTPTPEIKTIGVEVSEYRSGIPLKGFDSVAGALHIFASGETRKARATQDDIKGHLVKEHGLLGLGLYLLSTSGIDQDSFVNEMLQEAEPALKNSGYWSRHYDYDGMGTSFFKTSVEITKLPDEEDGYLLGLNAAYVGKAVEDGLAESLGVEQGLQWKNVGVTLRSDGRNFRIDFDNIAQRLQPIYEELHAGSEAKPALSGEAMLQAILTQERYNERETTPFILGVADGVEISLDLARVGNRFDWGDWNTASRKKELWRREAAVLTGPLTESYKKKGELEPPSISIMIRKHRGDRYSRIPAIGPLMKAKMNEIASRIASSFQ